ncbi:MAG TPA: dTMP kinase [Polyangia bacterium]|nr:dTMP kinase [Polyangia bacterium]
MARGHLIVFEGVDGAGTTTQAQALKRAFVARGLPAHVTAQPSAGPVGMLIRQVLSGRLVLHGAKAPGWATMALLFAADRQDHQEAEIEPNLRDGVNVICDRYLYSSVIYQSLSSAKPETVPWIREINARIRRPDLVMFLRVTVRDAALRREQRSGRAELYDDADFQGRLVERYNDLQDLFPDHLIVALDGARPVETIAAEAWAKVEALRAKGAPA